VLLDGESFSRTFNEAGTFQYFCTIHPTQMIATVVVNP
jgi:plastocyanin